MSNQLTVALKTGLVQHQKQFISLLGDKGKSDKFMASALALANDENVARCTPESVLNCIIGVAMLDLSIDRNLRHAYVVPYSGKATLQLGAHGLNILAKRAGYQIKTHEVYECDYFKPSFDGFDTQYDFVPDYDERQDGNQQWVLHNLKGILVVAKEVSTGEILKEYVSRGKIEQLRLCSPMQKGEPSGAWKSFYVEMAKAKAIKRMVKTLPIGDDRIGQAIAADDKAEIGEYVDYSQTVDNGYIVSEPIDVTPPQPVQTLLPVMPDEKFTQNFPAYQSQIQSGNKTAADIIGFLSTKWTLTDNQINALKEVG